MSRMAHILKVLVPATAFGAQRGSRRFVPPPGHRPPAPGGGRMHGCRYRALVPPRPTGVGGAGGGDASEPSLHPPP